MYNDLLDQRQAREIWVEAKSRWEIKQLGAGSARSGQVMVH